MTRQADGQGALLLTELPQGFRVLDGERVLPQGAWSDEAGPAGPGRGQGPPNAMRSLRHSGA